MGEYSLLLFLVDQVLKFGVKLKFSLGVNGENPKLCKILIDLWAKWMKIWDLWSRNFILWYISCLIL